MELMIGAFMAATFWVSAPEVVEVNYSKYIEVPIIRETEEKRNKIVDEVERKIYEAQMFQRSA